MMETYENMCYYPYKQRFLRSIIAKEVINYELEYFYLVPERQSNNGQ